MGDISLARLPEFFDRWDVRYETHGDWQSIGRTSGGFDRMMGVIIHHSASWKSAAIETTIRYALTAADNPIGNMIVSRDKDGPKVVIYAGLASNTAGRGGPMLSSRGGIPKDAANRLTVNIEAENNGTGEPWSKPMCDLYVRAVAATIDWANHCTPGEALSAGDVWSHREWAPTRKPDPAGPSRFNDDQNVSWNMDRFRGEVWLTLLGGPTPELPYAIGTPAPTMAYMQTGPPVGNLQDVLRFWGWLTCEDQRWAFGDCTWQGVVNMQLALSIPAHGTYDRQTARAYSDFLIAMGQLTCSLPPTSKRGSSGPRVADLQRFLASNDWYRATIDGQYGPLTEQGVQQLQRYARDVGAYNGSIHGQFDAATRDATCQIA